MPSFFTGQTDFNIVLHTKALTGLITNCLVHVFPLHQNVLYSSIAFFPNFTSNFLIWTLINKVKVKPYPLDLLMHKQALWTIYSSWLHQHAHLFCWPLAYLNPILSEPNSWKVFNLEASLETLNSSMIRLILNWFAWLLIALRLQSWVLDRLVINMCGCLYSSCIVA